MKIPFAGENAFRWAKCLFYWALPILLLAGCQQPRYDYSSSVLQTQGSTTKTTAKVTKIIYLLSYCVDCCVCVCCCVCLLLCVCCCVGSCWCRCRWCRCVFVLLCVCSSCPQDLLSTRFLVLKVLWYWSYVAARFSKSAPPVPLLTYAFSSTKRAVLENWYWKYRDRFWKPGAVCPLAPALLLFSWKEFWMGDVHYVGTYLPTVRDKMPTVRDKMPTVRDKMPTVVHKCLVNVMMPFA